MSTKSWFTIPRGSHFSLANLPFGIISSALNPTPRPAVAIGHHALCLEIFTASDGFSRLEKSPGSLEVFRRPTLNDFASLGRLETGRVRKYLQQVFAEDTEYPDVLKNRPELQKKCMVPLKDVTLHLPFEIGDYTDFYAGKNHAFNVGVLFRGPQNALQPNYTHLPVGYHGRASSVVVSGTPVTRPCGQILENPIAEQKKPIFSPSRRLDIELELGAFVAMPNPLGEPIPIEKASEAIFGYVLLNDWSARDIQAWEYVPLGPFNGKNFASTISPWVVHADAMEPFRTKGLANDTPLLQYLQEKEEANMLDVALEVELLSNKTIITRTRGSNLIFSFAQMLAHHSVGGCNMRTGDLLGSGTISGDQPGSEGSMLEQTSGGKKPMTLEGGEERTFLQDGDTVTIRGYAGSDQDGLVGFGECVGTIKPARAS